MCGGIRIELLNQYLQRFRIVLFDRRGTGLSTKMDEVEAMRNVEPILKYYSGQSIARDLGSLILHLRTNKSAFYIMGSSYGGIVAQMYKHGFS
jgi:pimeloyl-ACP methyl ester carboxylesterase